MALGRGLGELLGEIETAYENGNELPNSEVLEINIDQIKLNPYQPRKFFDEKKLQELSDSIQINGLLQPIVVTKDSDGYLLVAGERRLRATKLAGITLIKAIIIDIEESKLRELALIENIQRDDLNIIEIAYSYNGLIEDYDITHEELAKLVSKSRSTITNTLRLLTLSAFAQEMLSLSKISLGHAKLIIGLSSDEQKLVVESIIGQKLTVRETEQLVRKIKNDDQESEVKASKKDNGYNYSPLTDVAKLLNQNNLKVKVDDKYFKIKINSQEDIENIAQYFKNSL
jgi:ParB family chromosome partitioning protein